MVAAGRSFALLGAVQTTLILTITLLAVPLPVIGAEMGLNRSELIVVSAAYGLSFSGLLLFGGRLADRYGGRAVFVAGLVVFAAASSTAPASSGFGALALSRFGQGVGAALVAPSAMVLLRALFPDPDRYARAMATWGGLSVIGATAGLVLSGIAASIVSWRWMFAVPMVVAGLALLHARRLPPARPTGSCVALDIPGAVLATGGVTLLSFGLVMTDEHRWSSPIVTTSVACGAALLVAFTAVEARGRAPLLPLAFLTDRRRAAALVIIGLSATATAVVCLFLALYLQQIKGWSPLATSMAFVPYAVALLMVGRLAGRLVERLGATSVALIGVSLAAGGLLSLARLDPHTPYATGLLPGLLALPTGTALAFAAAAVLAVAGVPVSQMGLAGGAINTAMELGPTVGLALVSALAATHTGSAPERLDAVAEQYARAFSATGLAAATVAVLITLSLAATATAEQSRRTA